MKISISSDFRLFVFKISTTSFVSVLTATLKTSLPAILMYWSLSSMFSGLQGYFEPHPGVISKSEYFPSADACTSIMASFLSSVALIIAAPAPSPKSMQVPLSV